MFYQLERWNQSRVDTTFLVLIFKNMSKPPRKKEIKSNEGSNEDKKDNKDP